MVRLRKLRMAKKKAALKASLSPPSNPPRVGDKLLSSKHRGVYVVPGTTKVLEPLSEPNDSDETPDEDQSIPSGRRGDDDDVDETNPAAGGGNNDDDDDGDQDMHEAGGGNDDGDDDDGNGDKGKNIIEDEIVEEEEEQEEEGDGDGEGEQTLAIVQATEASASTSTGTKKRVITKPADSHMPSKHLMVSLKEGEPPKGTPADGGAVLFGYKHSWACTVHNTIDHKHAIRLMRRQASCSVMHTWNLDLECEEVKVIVRNSGLLPAVESSNINNDKVTISAFCERFYGETDTMLFPFGEMAITPDDAQQILGLEVDGKAVTEGFDNAISFGKIYELSKKLFGWSQVQTDDVLDKKDGRLTKKFNVKKLRDGLWKTQEILDREGMVHPVRINATAAAYLLYTLGRCIFPDSSGNQVEASYLQLLDPLHEMRGYSWGTAVVAFLNNELTKSSRALTKQVNGNTCLFQVWIYERFPYLFKDNSYVKVDNSVPVHLPRAQRYSFKGTQDKEMSQNLMKLRAAIDNLTAEEVIFDPYREDRNQGLIPRRNEVVALYYGPLMTVFEGFSMYDPHRVMRQLGYVQEEPHFDAANPAFTVDMSDCTTSQKGMNVSYLPAPTQEHWADRRRGQIDVSLLDEVTTGHEATEKYMAWYLGWARPTVIRPMTTEELARKKKIESKDPATLLKIFKDQLKTFVRVLCCAKDRGEPVQSKHIDYACNVDNEDAHLLFKQLQAEVKAEEKATKDAQAKIKADKKRTRSARGGEGSISGPGGEGSSSGRGGEGSVPKQGRGRRGRGPGQ